MDKDNRLTGRVTIPTDVDVVSDTLKLMERWGADAMRDCDGTDFPEALRSTGAKVYATYYTTRKDNDWAKAEPGRSAAVLHHDGLSPPQRALTCASR